jgi:hypothetical protein
LNLTNVPLIFGIALSLTGEVYALIKSGDPLRTLIPLSHLAFGEYNPTAAALNDPSTFDELRSILPALEEDCRPFADLSLK